MIKLFVQDNCLSSAETYFINPICLIKFLHLEQVWTGKATQSLLCSGKMSRKLLDHAVTPFSTSDLAADISPHLPVKINLGDIHHLIRFMLGRLDKKNHLIIMYKNGAGEGGQASSSSSVLKRQLRLLKKTKDVAK